MQIVVIHFLKIFLLDVNDQQGTSFFDFHCRSSIFVMTLPSLYKSVFVNKKLRLNKMEKSVSVKINTHVFFHGILLKKFFDIL